MVNVKIHWTVPKRNVEPKRKPRNDAITTTTTKKKKTNKESNGDHEKRLAKMSIHFCEKPEKENCIPNKASCATNKQYYRVKKRNTKALRNKQWHFFFRCIFIYVSPNENIIAPFSASVEWPMWDNAHS